MARTETLPARQFAPRTEPATLAEAPPAYLVMDSESVPDGLLINKVKYPEEQLSADQAVRRAQAEARERSYNGSDFLPVTFQYPVAVSIVCVAADYSLQKVACLDAPSYRPREIVRQFWQGFSKHRTKQKDHLKLVTFNGRGFDLPLMELAAFRYGFSCKEYLATRNGKYDSCHIDLQDFFQNYGAMRVAGGMNLLSKLLGKPGKMGVSGDQVYDLWLQGKLQEINDYCMHDTLDTYFIFLRTLVMRGEIDLEREHILTMAAKEWIQSKVADLPQLQTYLDNWGDWQPWP